MDGMDGKESERPSGVLIVEDPGDIENKEDRTDASTLLERHNKIMAAILTRFRNMVLAATENLTKDVSIPQASLNVMTMNNEVTALIKEIENLLALSREIKQLWIAGPLRKPGNADEMTRDKEIDESANKVTDMYNTLLELQNLNNQKKTTLDALVQEEEERAKANGKPSA
ncbi:hypothetical protein GGS20DRAFT_589220 [Poronia punctata]|nr:hypothetical protein GGS20DRAFT_589220 [Poronia punctata]